MARSSNAILRASPRISPQASSAVGWPVLAVPQTVTPRSLAAARSIEALRGPVETSSLSFGSRSNSARVNGVRSRMMQTTSKSLSRSTIRSGSRK
jgi:hypothetical protein